MPHDNQGHIYIQGGYGISVRGDVAYVLGRSTGDVGQLCGDVDANGVRLNPPVINKWAKFKPYRSSNRATTLTDRINAFYGLSVNVFENLGTPGGSTSGLFRNLVDGTQSWELAPPRGVNSQHGERFRVLDFDGYYHKAICPVGEIASTNIPISVYGDAQIQWDLESQLDNGNLKLTDLSIDGVSLSNFYLGILLYKSNNNYHFVTSDNILGEGDVSIRLSGVSSLAGTWRMYPFFSSVHYGLNDYAQVGKYLSAGWDTPFKDITFRLASESISVYAYGMWNAEHTQIQFYVEAFSEQSSERTISVQVVLRRNRDGGTEPTGESTLATYPNTIQLTVPAGGSARYPAGESSLTWNPGVTYDDSYFYWLGAAITSGGDYKTHFVPIEEDPSVMPE